MIAPTLLRKRITRMAATGDCYEAAGRLMLEIGGPSSGAVLVHGIVTGQGPVAGRRIDHAWVEGDGGYVMDFSNGRRFVLPISEYYALGEVKASECKRYTYDQMTAMMMRHEHWGPW